MVKEADVPDALRLVFVFRNGRWKLAASERVRMVVPAASLIPRLDQCAGAWIEVHGARGRLLYRRVISSTLIADSVEVRTDQPGRPLAHRAAARKTGYFSAVIPALPDARGFALVERRQARAGRRKGRLETREHARVDLTRLEPKKVP